jgi:hypothetical protein
MIILAMQDAAARPASMRMWRTSSPTTDSTPPATPPIYTPGLWRIEALEAARLLERGKMNNYSSILISFTGRFAPCVRDAARNNCKPLSWGDRPGFRVDDDPYVGRPSRV